MRPIKEQLESLRSMLKKVDAQKLLTDVGEPTKMNKRAKERIKCPRCGAKIKANNLQKHIRRVHEKKVPKGSIFGRRKEESLTSKQSLERERLQQKGFDEGAKVPGSNYRKIGR